MASWTLRAQANPAPYERNLRYQNRTYRAALRVGQPVYAPPFTAYNDARLLGVEIKLAERRLFGIVPGIPYLGLQPWLVAYLLLTVPGCLR